ncbi:uncharacterized protein [Heterodontus francisci]|uniref:uncharacterized protein n=1 Tax=Heterodontus francisci TaxID=7792 RepID=UPI00355C8B41
MVRCPHSSHRTPHGPRILLWGGRRSQCPRGCTVTCLFFHLYRYIHIVHGGRWVLVWFKIRIWVTSWCARYRHVQQLREHVPAGSHDNRRTAGHQASAQPHGCDDPLFRAMEGSMQAMTSAMSQAFERMASSVESLASLVECSIHKQSDLHSIAVALGSMQQSLRKTGTRNLDLPPGAPSPQGARQVPSCTQIEEWQLPQDLPLRTPQGKWFLVPSPDIDSLTSSRQVYGGYSSIIAADPE